MKLDYVIIFSGSYRAVINEIYPKNCNFISQLIPVSVYISDTHKKKGIKSRDYKKGRGGGRELCYSLPYTLNERDWCIVEIPKPGIVKQKNYIHIGKM